MRRSRFVAAVASSPGARARWEAQFEKLARDGAASWILNTGRLLALGCGDLGQPIGEYGILIGSIFKRASTVSPRLDDFSQLDAREFARHLVEHHWGGYVALQHDRARDSVSIIRAPLGDLPCFWSAREDAVLLGSDLALMVAAGLPPPPIEVSALARYLAREDLLTNETCLTGVAEVRGGQMLIFGDGRPRIETLWSPWSFASRGCAAEEAERRLRDSALLCVRALAKEQSGIVLRLSGGLDSSIVAACLRESGQKFTALNLVTADASGDERVHARRVAQSLGIPLVEAFRDVERVSLERSASARVPRPSARSFTQETLRICGEVAAETGSSANFDGGGGDNVFCSVQSARPAADCLMEHGTSPLFWQVAVSIAEIAQVSLWQVLRRAFSTALGRSPAYRWDVDLRFLSDEACADVTGAPIHPWLRPPPGTFPGKAAHVALLAAAQSVIEGFDPQEELPTFSPLIVQPFVETCLMIPSWQWFEAGRNRAAARRAFVGLLPKATLQRRSKGAPDSFIAELYESKRSTIRTMLMEGMLMGLGLLDREKLRETLDWDGPVRGNDFLRIMRLADAEAWARCWS